MKKFWCVPLSLILLSASSFAQQPLSPVRSIFVQDQRDRGNPLADNGRDTLSAADAKKLPHVSDEEMYTRDIARRKQVAALLHDGKLQTAEDFFYAALVFQHGSTADDYLLAHVLAMDALAKGDTGGRELAALTLDRYLQAAGKKQVFGTQFSDARYSFSLQHPDDKNLSEELKAIPASKQTLEPYDQKLLPDSLRADFCVPSQKQQNDYISAANSGENVDLPTVKHCAR